MTIRVLRDYSNRVSDFVVRDVGDVPNQLDVGDEVFSGSCDRLFANVGPQ